MKLPSVTTPEYKVKIPSGKVLTIRPFLAQEEKILLMAIEDSEKDEKSLQDALIQVLRNCVVGPANFDINTLSSIDIDFLFIELRKKSVSDIVTLEYHTDVIFEGCEVKECPETIATRFSLNDIQVKGGGNNIVMLSETVGLKLRYPTLGASQDNDVSSGKKTDVIFKTIADCIDQIFDDNESADGSSFKREDLIKWIETSVNHKALGEIMDFVSNAPYLSKTIKVVCPICKQEKDIEAKGLSDFFI